jgi:hypothetical protein
MSTNPTATWTSSSPSSAHPSSPVHQPI